MLREAVRAAVGVVFGPSFSRLGALECRSTHRPSVGSVPGGVMADTLYVATRKGLFFVRWHGPADWRVGGHSFLGDPVTSVLADAREGMLYAALNLGHFGVKLHRSGDGGASWEECAAPSFPSAQGAELDATPTGPSLKQVWALEAGGAGQAGRLWAGTNNGVACLVGDSLRAFRFAKDFGANHAGILVQGMHVRHI